MKKIAYLATSAIALALLTAPSFAADASPDDIATLKAEIAKLSKQVDTLETKEKATDAAVKKQAAVAPAPVAAAEPAPAIEAGSFPGSFHIPGTPTSVKIGGYVKLDAIADVGSGDGTPFARFYAIPLAGSQQSHQGFQTTMTAQQSRLNLETRTATALGELKTFVEGDFYSGSAASNSNTNGYGFELRHAYGSLGSNASGQLLAGQTWSNYMDTNAYSESMDYVGAAGRVFVRQAQIRYTHDLGPVTASASVEADVGNDTSFTTQNNVTLVNGSTATGRTTVPDITLRGDYHYSPDGYVSLRGLVGELNYDHASGTSNDDASRLSYAMGVSGKQVTYDKDNFRYDFNYGRGTGRYIFDIGAANNFVSGNGSFDEQQFFDVTAGYQHFWSSQFRSNLFGGAVRNVNETAITGFGVNKYVASGNLNLIWQPVDAYSVGVEYMHGYRKLESGVEGNLNRVETSFQYNF